MIPLKKFIENNITILDNNLLEKHFKLEFDIRNQLNYSLLKIDEKYGSYNGQVDLCLEISKQLYKDIQDNKSEINNLNFKLKYELDKNDLEEYFDTIFYKSLIIICGHSISGYQHKKSHYIEDEKVFDQVVIYLDINECKKTYKDIVSILTHELTHAWDNYSTYFKNEKLKLSDLIDKKYNELSKLVKENNIQSICKTILYLISNIENKAYISEINTVLDKEEEVISSYEKALELFKKTDVYKNYFGYRELLNKLEDQEDIDEFTNYYNKVNNSKYTFNKIKKKLLSQLDKIIDKILTNIPKIYYDYYLKHQQNESLLTRYNSSYIDFIECMKTYKSKLINRI